MSLQNNRVWDYQNDQFVHRLLQTSANNDKLVGKDCNEKPVEKQMLALEMECMTWVYARSARVFGSVSYLNLCKQKKPRNSSFIRTQWGCNGPLYVKIIIILLLFFT